MMFVVVFFGPEGQIRAVSKEDHSFIICYLFDDFEKARSFAESVTKLLGYTFRIFQEVQK